MAYKIFLDTNIIIDFFDSQRNDNQNAIDILKKINEGAVSGFVSESVITTTAYILSRTFKEKFDKESIFQLCEFITVLPCTSKTIINSRKPFKADFEDSILYEIALENNLDYFLTNDIKDFKKISNRSLPVVNYKQLFQQIK